MAGATATLISHRERFPVVGSTNDVVAGWLADGAPEVCLAVADEQASGRGRQGRSWQAPSGAALLVSLGFRPTWLEPALAWRIAAIVSLSMAEAAERIAGLEPNTIRLKWPNDSVAIDDTTGEPLKLAGVLGETTGLGTVDPRVIVGIGTNVDWARADFPPQIADSMTSLREVAGGSIDRDELHQRFLDLLEPAVTGLRRGAFDAGSWQRRQLTNDRPVRLQLADGSIEFVHARRVDPETGGLIVASNGLERTIMSGEVHHLRLTGRGPDRAHAGARV